MRNNGAWTVHIENEADFLKLEQADFLVHFEVDGNADGEYFLCAVQEKYWNLHQQASVAQSAERGRIQEGATGSSAPEVCSICLEAFNEMESETEVIGLDCAPISHLLCAKCITDWVEECSGRPS